MKLYSFFKEAWLLAKYLAGYFVLLLPVMAIIFDGRALFAQAQWFVSNIGVPDSIFVFSREPDATKPERVMDIRDISIPRDAFSGDVRAFLVVPKIKVAAPVVFPDTTDNTALLGYLERGVIKYKDASEIGSPGTAIILGHSSAYPWYRGQYGSVFALLSKLEQGDQFVIATKDRTFIYEVSGKKIIVPGDLKVEQTDGKSHIILISCWPVRTNKLRIVIDSDLIQTL